MLTHKTFAACFLVLASLVCERAADCQTGDPAARSIVENMAAQYANASSYQDTGVVLRVRGGAPGRSETIVRFKTHFARPRLFRFEWTLRRAGTAEEISSAVWNDGGQTFACYGWDRAATKQEDISLGLAGATGVSFGSAHTVPVLLMAEVGGFRLPQMTGLSLAGEENFEGEDCYVVRGYHPLGFPIDMWISVRDHLLRKTITPMGDDSSAVEIRRGVKINGDVPAGWFNPAPAQPRPKSAP